MSILNKTEQKKAFCMIPFTIIYPSGWHSNDSYTHCFHNFKYTMFYIFFSNKKDRRGKAGQMIFKKNAQLGGMFKKERKWAKQKSLESQ